MDRIVVVLVRARNPKNIGAVARAMHDFGFRTLRIVNEYAVPFEDASSAVDASEVLASAAVFTRLADAIADCSLVVGTTAIGERLLQHPVYALPQAGEIMMHPLAGDHSGDTGRVALLFGSEKTGLSNEELSHCKWLLTIPMEQHADMRHPSMNLGQAVAVCLYELVRQAGMDLPHNFSVKSAQPASAGVAQVERLALLLNQVLEAADYKRHHPSRSEVADIRRLVMRMDVSTIDAAVWMGILRQLLWRIAQEKEIGG